MSYLYAFSAVVCLLLAGAYGLGTMLELIDPLTGAVVVVAGFVAAYACSCRVGDYE